MGDSVRTPAHPLLGWRNDPNSFLLPHGPSFLPWKSLLLLFCDSFSGSLLWPACYTLEGFHALHSTRMHWNQIKLTLITRLFFSVRCQESSQIFILLLFQDFSLIIALSCHFYMSLLCEALLFTTYQEKFKSESYLTVLSIITQIFYCILGDNAVV